LSNNSAMLHACKHLGFHHGNGGLKLTPWRRNRFDPSTAFKERFASHLPPSREIAIGTLDGEF
jgi:hypothetical protein